MELNYESVPDMISGKDLDYLTDAFNWNYNAYKKAVNDSNIAEAEDIVKLLDKASNIFYSDMETILSILERGGCSE
ncbi:MAG: hypothetical protein IJ193_02645 [Bacilli bacterium]|nr:hypothetical protein [Bacilli bacterium]